MCLSIIQYSNGVIGFENIVNVEVNYTFNGFRYTICMCIEVYIRTTNKKRKKNTTTQREKIVDVHIRNASKQSIVGNDEINQPVCV